MRSTRCLLPVILLATLAACESRPPTPQPPPSTGGEERITGSERIGWDQPAADRETLATFRYAMYVDGSRVELTGTVCSDTAGPAGFACTARLPTMSLGSHTLELVAFTSDGAVLESARSAPLRVAVAAAVAPPATGRVLTPADPRQFAVEVVAIGLDDPTDLAIVAEDLLFVAERRGTVRSIVHGRLQEEPALVLDEVTAESRGGLLAMAADPQFDRTRFVYLVYTVRSSAGPPAFRVVRVREANGTLGQPVVLLDDIPAARERPGASLRFGPDEKLYLAFDDGGDPAGAAGAASYNGKVLRLNTDGTMPADQAPATPVFAAGAAMPRSLAWHPLNRALWIAEGAPEGSNRLHRLKVDDRSIDRTVSLPRAADVSGMAFHSGQGVPSLAGDLLVATKGPGNVLRVTELASGRRSIERLLLDVTDSGVGAIGVGPTGAIYLATRTTLARLVPRP